MASAFAKPQARVRWQQVGIDRERKHLADERLHPVCLNRLAGGDDAFAQLDDITPADIVVRPGQPFRQNMHGERSLVGFGSLFEPVGVLREVSFRERTEGAGHSY